MEKPREDIKENESIDMERERERERRRRALRVRTLSKLIREPWKPFERESSSIWIVYMHHDEDDVQSNVALHLRHRHALRGRRPTGHDAKRENGKTHDAHRVQG